MASILRHRSDGARVIWLHDHDDIEGFVQIAEYLQKKYNAKIINKILVDVELWEFQISGVHLGLVGDSFGNELVATDPNAFSLLEKICDDLNSNAVEKTTPVPRKG